MNVLVCGDIHGRVEDVKTILQNTDHHIVFVGDYIDSYDRTSSDQIEALELVLNARETRDNVTALLGNHEISYLYPDYRCSGWNPRMQAYVDKHRERIVANLDLFVLVGDYLITHAGVSANFLPKDVDHTIDAIVKYLTSMPEERIHEVSPVRGGYNRVGGPLWCDWAEFKPIPGIKQVMGHTTYRPGEEKGILHRDGNYNVDCLDHKKEILELTSSGAIFRPL